VTEEPGFVAFGGQADQVSATLKERFSDDMTLAEALGAALAALAAPGNGNGGDAPLTASQLEVAILDRARSHRAFRRLQGARLEQLLTEARAASADADADSASSDESSGPEPSADEPPTGPETPSSDGTN
jgi:proteasome alpha subunit